MHQEISHRFLSLQIRRRMTETYISPEAAVMTNEEGKQKVRRYLDKRARARLHHQIYRHAWPEPHGPTVAADGPPRRIGEQPADAGVAERSE
jgi:hypothetical protein